MTRRKRVLWGLLIGMSCAFGMGEACWVKVEAATAPRPGFEPAEFAVPPDIEPVFVPPALINARAIEIGHLEDFAELAALVADDYRQRGKDCYARVVELQSLIAGMEPGPERDELKRQVGAYWYCYELNRRRLERVEELHRGIRNSLWWLWWVGFE